MSLNRALADLFKAVRDEAARNPDFAARIGEAMALYKPPRRPRRPRPPAPATPFDLPESLVRERLDNPAPAAAEPPRGALAINPITVFSRDGEDALRRVLEGPAYSREALAALAAEHNLDPAGAAAGADKQGLIEQIVGQAKRRVERDRALFNY